MHFLIQAIAALILMFLLPASSVANPCDKDDPTRCRIDVELHKSVLKHTDRPITRISIADPETADYHLVTPTQILLITKEKVGATNLIVWYEKEGGRGGRSGRPLRSSGVRPR